VIERFLSNIEEEANAGHVASVLRQKPRGLSLSRVHHCHHWPRSTEAGVTLSGCRGANCPRPPNEPGRLGRPVSRAAGQLLPPSPVPLRSRGGAAVLALRHKLRTLRIWRTLRI
jgi:hypothetical protein